MFLSLGESIPPDRSTPVMKTPPRPIKKHCLSSLTLVREHASPAPHDHRTITARSPHDHRTMTALGCVRVQVTQLKPRRLPFGWAR
jgi:hypothetical protein